MGGSGGGNYTSREIEILRAEAARRLEESRLETEVNTLLQDELITINDRDVDFVNDQLDRIERALEEEGIDVDRLLFGGSIAKHTYVDGISDIDSLVILKNRDTEISPQEARDLLADALRAHLPQGEIADISVGNLAVTLTYRNGDSIQLLPAVATGTGIAISSATGNRWSEINPSRFSAALTDANRRQGGMIVPTIKLAKAILDHKMGDQRPSGYHVETLAIEAFREYNGPRTAKAMVTHFLDSASRAVLQPMADVTGQSTHVDGSLGEANSRERVRLSSHLTQLARIAQTANNTAQWRDLIG